MTLPSVQRPEAYGESYYGHGDQPPIANYQNYQHPSWSMPLAELITTYCLAPYLDVGAAFGHLIMDIGIFAGPFKKRMAVEYSDYASHHAATHMMTQASGLSLPLRSEFFRTVISMDYLEHFVPEVTRQAIDELDRVTKRGGTQVHLIGWPQPGHEDGHYQDPTHQNHELLGWYYREFINRGYQIDRVLLRRLRTHPHWRDSDWYGRWAAFKKP